MKIKLLSDLHLEGRTRYRYKHNDWAEYDGEDVLILAGDIAVGVDKVFEAIDYFLAQGFPEIVYVAGNHESYRTLQPSLFIEELRKAFEHNPYVHILNADSVVQIQDVSFFGGTLWTNFQNDPVAELAASTGINDFRVIPLWNTELCAKEHKRQIDYILNRYEETKGKKVIVTHFLPAMECVDPRYLSGTVEMLLNKYFASNYGGIISEMSDTTWVFGHTHTPVDFMLGDTRMIANPLGYSGERVPYVEKVFEV